MGAARKLEIITPSSRSNEPATDAGDGDDARMGDIERAELQEILDLLEGTPGGITAVDEMLARSIVLNRKLERQARDAADWCLSRQDLDGWNKAASMAIRFEAANRSAMRTLKITPDVRAGRVGKAASAKQAAQTSKWNKVLGK